MKELRFTYAGQRWYAIHTDIKGWVINLALPRYTVFEWDEGWSVECRVPGSRHHMMQYDAKEEAMAAMLTEGAAEVGYQDEHEWPEGIPQELLA